MNRSIHLTFAALAVAIINAPRARGDAPATSSVPTTDEATGTSAASAATEAVEDSLASPPPISLFHGGSLGIPAPVGTRSVQASSTLKVDNPTDGSAVDFDFMAKVGGVNLYDKVQVDIVGEQYAGAENARLRESLQWMRERFEEIALDDKNLPAIVEHRVLIPKDEAAKATLRGAFEQLRKSAGASWQTMLGADDAAAFQKLYPFSPALVDVLVALSNSLQRQRTAIKLLMELLVEHIDDLMIGEVVRVGDLFDLLAAGEESADGVMRARFESAKHIYKVQLLPLIREQHGTGSAARCQRMRPEYATRLGCAGCPEKPCRTDNRLAKTLLVAALVPETTAVKDLTASRLVQSIRSRSVT